MKKISCFFICALLLSACAHNKAKHAKVTTEDVISNKASFDLGCDKGKLNIVELEKNNMNGLISYGVTGCKKKVSYICQRNVFGPSTCVKESETTRVN